MAKVDPKKAKATFEKYLNEIQNLRGVPWNGDGDHFRDQLSERIRTLIKLSFDDYRVKLYNYHPDPPTIRYTGMYGKEMKKDEQHYHLDKLHRMKQYVVGYIEELELLSDTDTKTDVKDDLKNLNPLENENTRKRHDFFICHATEDKEDVARPLAKKLNELGLDVWYDEFSLRWGSKLMKTITKGIKESKFGIVILSPKFLEKKWAQLELDAFVALLNLDDGELLPLLYNLTPEEAKERLPLLSGILYRTWEEGLDPLAAELKAMASGNISEFRKANMIQTKSISKSKSSEFDLTLDKYTENANHYVGIRNAKGSTIKSCMVLCNGEKCAWWDTGDFLARHIYEGGGGNVLLPRGFANTNPMITVKSDDEIIEQIELSKIVHRPSSNWNAEDENTVFVDRLNIALGRIRSNLATMRSLFQMFVEHPKVPILPEMKIHLSQKNELVENTQTVVNQASHVLDVSWMNDLNDLCSLAKKNPWFLDEGAVLQIMQCQSCQGVISQIDNLLKRLPNSPL